MQWRAKMSGTGKTSMEIQSTIGVSGNEKKLSHEESYGVLSALANLIYTNEGIKCVSSWQVVRED